MIGCQRHHRTLQLKKIDLEAPLNAERKRLLQDTTINEFVFQNLLPFSDWDEIAIISPYARKSSVTKLRLRDTDMVWELIEKTALNDSQFTLLFLKNKGVVGYAYAKTMVIDLEEILPNGSDIPVMTKYQSNHLKIKRRAQKGFKALVLYY